MRGDSVNEKGFIYLSSIPAVGIDDLRRFLVLRHRQKYNFYILAYKRARLCRTERDKCKYPSWYKLVGDQETGIRGYNTSPICQIFRGNNK